MTVKDKQKMAKAARAVLDGLCAFLDANGSEDGQRLRAAVDYVGSSVPGGAIECVRQGDVVGAVVETVVHNRKRRRREG